MWFTFCDNIQSSSWDLLDTTLVYCIQVIYVSFFFLCVCVCVCVYPGNLLINIIVFFRID